ncbi:biotin--[acetyl-CoA-carboxylase] ligase [Magnetococcales bacterium HHB-1]
MYLNDEEKDELTKSAITPLLLGETCFSHDRYHFFSSLPSTNSQLTAMAHQGAQEGTVVVAEAQTAGRGRLQRQWISPEGVNLAFSLLLRPNIPTNHIAQITLLSGLVLARTLKAQGIDVQLKWPNDLLSTDGRKLAGILTEMAHYSKDHYFIVVGIGVNVNSRNKEFPKALQTTIQTMREISGKRFMRRALLADYLKRYTHAYHRYLKEGFATVRSHWLEFAAIKGKRIQITETNHRYTAQAVDLDEAGFLIVETATGEKKRVLAGDVTFV